MASFWEKFKPAIVLAPALVALHYGWFYIQGNEKLYPQKGEKLTEQPIVTVI